MLKRPTILLLLALLGRAQSAWSLSAAAAKVDITPDLRRERVYMAGFGAVGRRPHGVHDPLYARLLLLSDGKKTLAVVGLDVLGLYRNDVEDLRRLAGFDGPDRYLFVAATHTHSGPDTLALWGPMIGVSGVNKAWHAAMKAKIAAALKALYPRLAEVSVSGYNGKLDPRGLCRDSRDPVVIDPHLGALSFKAKGGKTVATLVNWSCHPETLGRDNRLITADFPGPLCARVEEKTGGACLYLSGLLGGLLTPDLREGKESFYESYRIGTAVADAALKGLAGAAGSAGARLAWRSKVILVPIENSRYLLFLPALTFGHRLFDASGASLAWWKQYWLPLRHALLRLKPSQRPWVETEVSVLEIGPATLLGIPGEIFPELVLGGYDGSLRAGHPLINPDNPDPPDLKAAPKGPYLRERIHAPLKFVAGLANDELGYIIPDYDFKARPGLTMLPRLPGHHYEETNSIGPSATGLITKAAADLLGK